MMIRISYLLGFVNYSESFKVVKYFEVDCFLEFKNWLDLLLCYFLLDECSKLMNFHFGFAR